MKKILLIIALLTFCTTALAEPPPTPNYWIYDPVNNIMYPAVPGAGIGSLPSGGGAPQPIAYNPSTGLWEFGAGISAPSGDFTTMESDEVSTPAPTTKGHPDTSTLMNSSGVPTTQYTPETLTSDANVPVLSEYVYKTASYTIPSSQAYNKIYSNYGATGAVTFTLPTAVPGMNMLFVNETGIGAAGQVVNIDPASADRIYYSVSGELDSQTVICDTAGDKLVSSADWGTSIILYCPAAGRWIATNARQTWSDGN